MTISRQDALSYLIAIAQLKAIASTTSGDFDVDVVGYLENDLRFIIDKVDDEVDDEVDPQNDEPKAYAKKEDLDEFPIDDPEEDDEFTPRKDGDVFALDLIKRSDINARVISSQCGEPNDKVSIKFCELGVWTPDSIVDVSITNLDDEENITDIEVSYVKRGARKLSLGEESDGEILWNDFSVSKFDPDFVRLLSVNKVYRVTS